MVLPHTDAAAFASRCALLGARRLRICSHVGCGSATYNLLCIATLKLALQNTGKISAHRSTDMACKRSCRAIFTSMRRYTLSKQQ